MSFEKGQTRGSSSIAIRSSEEALFLQDLDLLERQSWFAEWHGDQTVRIPREEKRIFRAVPIKESSAREANGEQIGLQQDREWPV